MLSVRAIRQNFQIFFVIADRLSVIVVFLVSLTQQNSGPSKIVLKMNGVFISFNSSTQITLALIVEPYFNVLIRLIRIINFRFFR